MGNLLTDFAAWLTAALSNTFIHANPIKEITLISKEESVRSKIVPSLRRTTPKMHTIQFNNADLFYICKLFKVFCFFLLFFKSIKIDGSIGTSVYQWLLISPVESVGDDVVVNKLPSPAELNRDVELKEADRWEMWGEIHSQPEEWQEKDPGLVPVAMSGCTSLLERQVNDAFSVTGTRARSCFTCWYFSWLQL